MTMLADPIQAAGGPGCSALQPGSSDDTINLYELGMLFVVRCRYWSCRAGNEAEELDLTAERIEAKALASFGSKDLLDPDRTRKVFQQIEKKARHALEKHSRPFAAAGARFVPWNLVPVVIEQMEAAKAEFDAAVQTFLAEYATLRSEWRSQHPQIPDACYPPTHRLPERFGLTWHAFKVTGAPELSPVADIGMAIEERAARERQVELMERSLREECGSFVEQYVTGFRREVAEFCDQVVEQKGQVHGRTLTAIRDRIDQFHAMNIFGDADAAGRLTKLKVAIAGLTGQDLASQPDVAAKLSRACELLRSQIMNPDNLSQLTGRLKRKVVLD